MSLLNMGGKEIDLLNLKRMQEEMALMNQQAQRMGVTGIDTPQLGQQAPAPAQAPVQAPAPVAAPAPAQKTGFMQSIKNKMQDPAFMARLTAGLNSMRYAPSAAIAAQSQAVLEEQRAIQRGNQTAQQLRNSGRGDLADMIEASPENAATIYSAYLQQQLKPKTSFKQKSGAQLNTELGVSAFDPAKMYNVDSTGKVTGIGGDAPVTNIDLGGETGIDEVNKSVAKEYTTWIGGGAADATKNVAQIANAVQLLQSGDITTGVKSGLIARSGLGAFLDPEGTGLREQVEEVVQRNLRVVLGAQFTEKEGERLINRAYNPSLSTQQNLKKLNALFTQMQTALDQKNAMMQYFQKNQFNILGYEGNIPSITDFDRALDAVNAPKVGSVINGFEYLGGDPSLESSYKKVN